MSSFDVFDLEVDKAGDEAGGSGGLSMVACKSGCIADGGEMGNVIVVRISNLDKGRGL